MPFQNGVQIGKCFAIRAVYFQLKMNAGRPGFFGFIYGNQLIGQYFNRLFVLLDLTLNQHASVFYQKIPRIGKHARKNDHLHCPVHVLNGNKGHQIPFFGVEGLGTLDESANAHGTPIIDLLNGDGIGIGKLIQQFLIAR